MFDEMPDLVASFFEKQREVGLRVAEWLYRNIRKVTNPPTPVYIPEHPMTPEELERVRPRHGEEE